MKGIIFNVVQEVVEQEFGHEAWEAILQDAGIEGVYTSLGTYPDADVYAIVQAAANKLGVTPSDVLRLAGRNGIQSLYARYSMFFDKCDNLQALLESLDGVIHVEVRKMYEGSQTPTFEVQPRDGGMNVVYRSARRMPDLAAGLIEGAALHYEQPVTVEIAGEHEDGIMLHVNYQ